MNALYKLILLVVILLTAGQASGARNTNNMEIATETAAASQSESAGKPQYTVTAFLELVKKYQNEDGNIDYQSWKDSTEDMERLNQQVELLAKVSPVNSPGQFSLPASVRSYWINTYNTLVIQAVLEYWPLESVRAVKISVSSRLVPGKGFFYDRKVVVGGHKTNLYQLEKEVLKSQKDPRLHFALNCASGSCPVLRSWEWTDEQLNTAAREFVNNPANVKVDDGTVFLSRIFKWYRKDFPKDTYTYLQQFADAGLGQQLQSASDNGYPTKYFEYDWGINADVDDAEKKGSAGE
jgi:hypothetical protein